MLFLLIACLKSPLTLVESTPTDLKVDDVNVPNAATLWVELFDKAERSIDIGTFYISPSPKKDALDPVWRSLENASLRGVKIRVLVDKKFSSKYPDPLDELRTWKNTEVRLSDYQDSVMHAKYFIVDNQEAFVGSHNFDYRALEHIFELGYHIRDPELVKSIQDIYETDWSDSPLNATSHIRSNTRYQIVASPPHKLPNTVKHDLPAIKGLIEGARRSVNVQLLSYTNFDYAQEYWYILDDALINAVKRGVSVELLVSDWSLTGHKGKSLSKLESEGVAVKYVTVPEHPNGPIPYARTIHSKILVVDDRHCWLGSSNWSHDYFYKSRNVGIILSSKRECRILFKRFQDVYQSKWSQTFP
ncbi:MAG: phospholipase D-like domain-containing protein [Myxococcota bacterium]|nr:phospholipase D-like domain-containing protein [Myxococcota bacterium]